MGEGGFPIWLIIFILMVLFATFAWIRIDRSRRLTRLSDDEWCMHLIRETVPTSYMFIHLNSVESPMMENSGNIKWDVEEVMNNISGKYHEFFRWFIAYQDESVSENSNKDFYAGFVGSDLKLYLLPRDIGLL